MNLQIDYIKLSKATLSLLPLSLIFGCFILWSYLNDIGRIDLLPSVIDSKGTFIALIISFFTLSVGLLIILCLPSMMLCQMCFLTWNNEFSRVINLSRIPFISCSTSILYIASIIIFSLISEIPYYIKDYISIITPLLLLPITFIVVHFFSKKRKKIHIYYKKGKEIRNKKFIKEKIIISFFSFSSGMTITIPLLLILNISTLNSNAGLIVFCVISIILVFISFSPAIVFFGAGGFKTNIKDSVIYFIMSALTVFIIIMSSLPNFSSLVVRSALKNIGVIESESHIYSLKKQHYTHDMFPTSVWTHINSASDEYLFITGTVIFSLGDNVLICPTFVTDAQNKYRKYNLDNLFSHNETDFEKKHLKQIIKSCALINRSDITRWDGILDGKNVLNP
ncbi:hypothetical protein GW590_11305 [Rahnella sp. SAP-1]|uniref:Uncharacterized protein n=1 Tax=Rouxiella aceris TaxID=2703884 RepID=A0A848MJM3_9GAMM|nr:hypothetical protein [Rouxiella aceris]NMP27453.1 hypothetical protein [Rouxiella aceris]